MKKRLLFLGCFLFMVISLFACNKTKYKLTIIDDYGYLTNNLNDYYEEGEEIKVRLVFTSGVSVGIIFNDVKYDESNLDVVSYENDEPNPIFTLKMPNKDCILYTTCNGFIKECKNEHQYGEGVLNVKNPLQPKMIYVCKMCGHEKIKSLEEIRVEALIIDCYKKQNNITDIQIDKIYAEYISGNNIIVPFMIAGPAHDTISNHIIDNINFYYQDSRKIEVYDNGKIISLDEAYEQGIITRDNLIGINKIQNDNCKLGHSWDEGKIIQVPGGGEEKEYTCYVCDEKKYEDIKDNVVYSLSIIGDSQYVTHDITGEYNANSLIMIEVQNIFGIEVYVNDQLADIEKITDEVILYSFSMPEKIGDKLYDLIKADLVEKV